MGNVDRFPLCHNVMSVASFPFHQRLAAAAVAAAVAAGPLTVGGSYLFKNGGFVRFSGTAACGRRWR
jgi:hypothetical protein